MNHGIDVQLESSWKEVLQDEFSKPYFVELVKFVRQEYASGLIYPPGKYIFRALNTTPFSEVKVVILGQDPYHGPKQANGLAFSVDNGVQVPPSLQNIYKEIKSDIRAVKDTSGNLEHWAKQGVLLLNATLTVKAGLAGSHQKKGWEQFSDAVIKSLAEKRENLVFILWGRYAQQKGNFIDESKHLVLKAAHPSPLSAHNGFFGCKHFSKCNEYLESVGRQLVAW